MAKEYKLPKYALRFCDEAKKTIDRREIEVTEVDEMLGGWHVYFVGGGGVIIPKLYQTEFDESYRKKILAVTRPY